MSDFDDKLTAMLLAEADMPYVVLLITEEGWFLKTNLLEKGHVKEMLRLSLDMVDADGSKMVVRRFQ